MQRLTKQLETQFHEQLTTELSTEGVNLVRTQSHIRVPRTKRRATVSALKRMGWRPVDSSTSAAYVYARPDGSWPVELRKDNGNLSVMASTLELPPALAALRAKSHWYFNDAGVLTMSAPRTPAYEKQALALNAQATPVEGLVWQSRMQMADHEFVVYVYSSTVCVTVWPPVRHKQ
jgi:hypothetical protein